MRHSKSHTETLIERLRVWKLRHPGASFAQAKTALIRTITDRDIGAFVEDWLSKNFERVVIERPRKGSVTAKVIPLRRARKLSPQQKARLKKMADDAARSKADNFFEAFSGYIWDSVLPNGVSLRKAKGSDLLHGVSVYAKLAKFVKPNESVFKKISTEQLFNVTFPDEARKVA